MATYDIVFAGGGAAACVAAGRLAAADPNLKILILEAGEHTKGLDAHVQPARYFSHLAPTSKTVTFNIGKPSENIGGRSLVTPSGRCLGGGSSVNFTMYTRAAASDYDDWETVFRNNGWHSRDLLPLLKKTETYQVEPNQDTHGYDGPLKVSLGGTITNVGKRFMDVALKIDKDRGPIHDVNGLYEWIDRDTGRRSDVPHHYIYNQEHNKNLAVLTGKRVKRVIFEGDKAVGVEYVNDTVLNPNADQTVEIAKAAKLVVVSAGAFGSPTILERSGIGGSEILKKHGVRVKVDLPGVDHNVCFIPYQASDEAETMDALFRGDEAEVNKWLAVWSEGKGLLAHNGLDAGIKMRPTAEDLKELGPEFEHRWKSYFENAPDKPVIWVGAVSCNLVDPAVATPRKYYSVGYFTQYPVSLGHVHITSGDDANASHDFDPNFLADRADHATLRWGYKKAREIARRMSVYKGDHLPGHPAFSPDSDAAVKDETKASGPTPIDAPNIKYTKEDDKVIEEFNKVFVQTAWHSLGTCAMKPRDQGGVVDSRLNVYGVTNLKVADISICPANVAANTYSTALTIGEKAAVLIAEELGVKL
ncbi:alcohol oxidase-like protein [Moniliophthora roreri]|nr:alcohol oxidase-like protein [Moniliophthora roreri]